ncbi:MAG TPA: TRAP transporter substrate-binding protein [Burkholderiales bacterium]|nr:TRAP transporter substrate-binding protein [Burkholderiales bacterium]
MTPTKITPTWKADQVHSQPRESHLQKYLEMLWDGVRDETGGRLQVAVHPSSMNIAGAGPNVLKRVQSGEIAFHVLMGPGLAHAVPAMEIQGVPFAFTSSEQVAKVMDGALGDYLRAEMAAKGLYGFPCGLMENGFRQIVSADKPIRTADDLAGYRMRVPGARIIADVFDALGATPVTVSVDRLYTALRDGEVDGQENPLVVCEENRLYEVCRHVSITNHLWSGFNVYANLEFWNALPGDVQEIVNRHVANAVRAQRANVRSVNAALERGLAERGMVFNTADTTTFRRLLTTGFYGRWKNEVGHTAWSLLEAEVGKLAA